MSSAELAAKNATEDCRDERLVEALDRYIDSLKSGIPLPKHQLLVQYSDVGEELETCLASLDFIGHANPNGSAALPCPGETRLPRSTDGKDDLPVDPGGGDQHILGDYKILREVGRGGMGVVYEARQISLDRQVALKVLPFAAALDRRQLERFKQEARAAAQLHHSNIVPVFAVGAERGVHYYAMQFVDGQSLADLIQQLRQDNEGVSGEQTGGVVNAEDSTVLELPSTQRGSDARDLSRMAAEFGVKVALALDYAHEQGIVHRDVKPSNLMIQSPRHVWVADFGLARLETEPGLTMTGDLVGTLRYMSPEQLLGNRVPVDCRTDVYSLGATLYELLTYRPPFEGSDRNELVRKISFEDPPLPRRLNKDIPVELETILLKSLSKSPEARYATANEFAADLQRFLDDKPITARRPSIQDRLGKWAKRHRGLVQVCLAVLLIGCVGLLMGTIMLAQERSKTKAALKLSEDHFENAHNAVTAMFNVIDRDQYYKEPAVQPIIRDTAEVAAAYLTAFANQRGDNARLQWKLAVTQLRLGKVWAYLGEKEQSATAYASALQTAEHLVRLAKQDVQENRSTIRARQQLARAYRIFAFSTKQFTGDLHQADEEAAKMCNILVALVDEHPGRTDLRSAYGHALMFRADLIDDDEANNEKCLELVTKARRHLRVVFGASDDPNQVGSMLASALTEIGTRLSKLDRHEEALTTFREAIAVRKQLDGEQNSYIGRLQQRMAFELKELDRIDEAAVVALKARDKYRQLIVDRGALRKDRDWYCMVSITSANLLRRLQRYDEITAILRDARQQASGLAWRHQQIGCSLGKAAHAVHHADEELTDAQARLRDKMLSEAFRSLSMAIDSGWTDFEVVSKHSELELLRSQPEYEGLIARIADNATKDRADDDESSQ